MIRKNSIYCSVPGCSTDEKWSGMCELHYWKMVAEGTEPCLEESHDARSEQITELRDALESVTDALESFANFYQRAFMHPTGALNEMRTGDEVDFINHIDGIVRTAREVMNRSAPT